MTPRNLLKLGVLACALLLIPASGADARKVVTKITAPAISDSVLNSRIRTYPHHLTEFDRVNDNLTFIAYDKKASSDKETFFIDNGSDVALSFLEVEISYFNLQGKAIHKRTVELNQLIPAHETRKADIPSWDRQKSFHYVNSVPSAKGNSTPYTVRFRLLSFVED